MLQGTSNMFDWLVPLLHQGDEHKQKTVAMEERSFVLLEIVGTMGLSNKAKTHIDPYCIVKVSRKEVHRTKAIQDDGNPIWTVKTNSLCLLEIPDGSMSSKSGTTAAVTTTSSHSDDDDGAAVESTKEKTAESTAVALVSPPGAEDSVTIEIYHGMRLLGTATVFFDEVLQAVGDRVEYAIQPPPKLSNSYNISMKAVLALRFRKATRDDLIFLGKIKAAAPLLSPQDCRLVASDIDCNHVLRKSIFQSNSKMKDKKQLFRVMPYPDPSRPKETEWMTKDEIHEEALKPSVRWVQAGYGIMGTVYVEIIGCDNLPNLDLSAVDLTDPFVGIVFEDNFVRTDIIWDELNPRWMPWTTRAFAFQVRHPSSIIMLGVFDHDETPLDHHDTVGRVVIDTANFECDTTYLLHHQLHHDPRQEDSRGTIVVRLRIEWKNEGEAMKMALTPAPRFIINTETEKAYSVLHYLTRGAVDMEKVNLDSVKLYANELVAYWENYCFFLDVVMGIFLWRGRLQVSKNRSIWFPLHSMVLLFTVALAFERPLMIPPIFFYGIAWIMLSINYNASRHPNPWKRVKSSERSTMVVLLGRSLHPPIEIEPNQGVQDGEKLSKLDILKAERISTLVQELMRFSLKVYGVYSKTSETSVKIGTEEANWSLLAGRLLYIHMLLKYLCQYVRMFRGIINWNGYYAHSLTMNCIIIATVWTIFPVGLVMSWAFRLLIWTMLGPWMKLLDVYWAHTFYKTREELLQDIDNGVVIKEPSVPDFDAWLASDMFIKMGHSGRIVAEDQYKLMDIREKVFGKYCETIPKFDSSRYPSVPLPQSSAQPSKAKPKSKEHWYHVPGQKLAGHMILQPEREEIPFAEEDDDDDDSGVVEQE